MKIYKPEDIKSAEGLIQLDLGSHFAGAFSYGQLLNYSFDFGEQGQVSATVDTFLTSSDLDEKRLRINLSPTHTNDLRVIGDGEKEMIKNANLEDRNVSADGIFAKDTDVILTCKPADCSVFIVTFTYLDEEWCGLVHIGIHEYALDTIQELRKYLDHDFPGHEDLKIQVLPFLQTYRMPEIKKDSDIYRNYLSRLVDKFERENGEYTIDILKMSENQMNEHFSDIKVTFFEVDNWVEAEAGNLFSNSYAYFHEEFENGRNIVAVQINH